MRELRTITKGTQTIDNLYNEDGIRVKKTIADSSTGTSKVVHYILDGDTIIAIQDGDNLYRFYYDVDGVRTAMEYGGNMYYYQYNLQGDVTGIYDSNFNLVTTYLYDAYGFNYDVNGTMAETIGTINPFRYRGYYLDEETGFYYLNSRYYDPETGRFINADGYISTGQGFSGNNMFVYCGNDPINNHDASGERHERDSGCFAGAGLGAPYSNGSLASDVGTAVIVATTIVIAMELSAGVLRQEMFALRTYNKERAKSKSKTLPIPVFPEVGEKYYHSTTLENFVLIKGSGTMTGSYYEGGYVYAWKLRPSRTAIKNSGAHTGVVISFRTSASFARDIGIEDPIANLYGPVVSTRPGPITVWDVKIVGVS